MIRVACIKNHARHFRQTRSFHSSRRNLDNEKLRILFCGSDLFSTESLKALHAESRLYNNNIQTIEVVTRTDKRAGRGLKNIKSPAIKPVAQELNLPLHQIDTFRGWTPPSVDLIVAVSFGLLIPSRIINASKYGGMNVHPSLLPELRGASPIQGAIIHGLKDTGASIQTLHPTKFDEGIILDQTPPIPVPEEATYKSLSSTLAPVGAELLVKAIRKRLYEPPYQGVTTSTTSSHAPRITTTDRYLDCFGQNAVQLERRSRALTKMFATTTTADGSKLRLQFLQIQACSAKADVAVGVPYAVLDNQENTIKSKSPIYINTSEGCIQTSTIVVEGRNPQPAVQAAALTALFTLRIPMGDKVLYRFPHALTME